MKIKKATAKDFAEIKKLIALYPDKLKQSSLPKVREFFVAVVSERIVGCCALEVYSKRLAEIRSLAVYPEFQKKGIGTALVKRCLAEAKNLDIEEVLTITGSKDFFANLGFDTFNREKFALLKTIIK